MVAGPWFTVQDADTAQWEPFGRVWVSDGGQHDGVADLQLKLTLLEPTSAPGTHTEVADAG
ncbi:MAG: hypothetical protein KTR31_28180 [Myxococcales bacterium]|nr:hypothetical protein [Myxococcales bacterium]